MNNYHGREILALHNAGKTPSEIAEALHIGVAAVKQWMMYNEIICNSERRTNNAR